MVGCMWQPYMRDSRTICSHSSSSRRRMEPSPHRSPRSRPQPPRHTAKHAASDHASVATNKEAPHSVRFGGLLSIGLLAAFECVGESRSWNLPQPHERKGDRRHLPYLTSYSHRGTIAIAAVA